MKELARIGYNEKVLQAQAVVIEMTDKLNAELMKIAGKNQTKRLEALYTDKHNTDTLIAIKAEHVAANDNLHRLMRTNNPF
jgi:hypothetical protein